MEKDKVVGFIGEYTEGFAPKRIQTQPDVWFESQSAFWEDYIEMWEGYRNIDKDIAGYVRCVQRVSRDGVFYTIYCDEYSNLPKIVLDAILEQFANGLLNSPNSGGYSGIQIFPSGAKLPEKWSE